MSSLFKKASAVVANKLSGLQDSPSITFSSATTAATYDTLNIGPTTATSALTQLGSINVPAGKKLILLNLIISISGNNVAGNLAGYEVEIDGVVVLSKPYSASFGTQSTLRLVGSNTSTVPSNTVKDLLVETNLKVRFQYQTSNNVTLTVAYMLVEA